MQLSSLLLSHHEDVVKPKYQLVNYMAHFAERDYLVVELGLLVVLFGVELVLNILYRVHIHKVAKTRVIHQLLIIQETPCSYLATIVQLYLR